MPAGSRGSPPRVDPFQVCAFVLLEVLERVTAGAPLAELIHTGILPIGIVTQAAIGYLAAQAIRWLLRSRRSRRRGPRSAGRASAPVATRPLLPELVFVPAGRHLSATGVRGPPSSV